MLPLFQRNTLEHTFLLGCMTTSANRYIPTPLCYILDVNLHLMTDSENQTRVSTSISKTQVSGSEFLNGTGPYNYKFALIL